MFTSFILFCNWFPAFNLAKALSSLYFLIDNLFLKKKFPETHTLFLFLNLLLVELFGLLFLFSLKILPILLWTWSKFIILFLLWILFSSLFSLKSLILAKISFFFSKLLILLIFSIFSFFISSSIFLIFFFEFFIVLFIYCIFISSLFFFNLLSLSFSFCFWIFSLICLKYNCCSNSSLPITLGIMSISSSSIISVISSEIFLNVDLLFLFLTFELAFLRPPKAPGSSKKTEFLFFFKFSVCFVKNLGNLLCLFCEFCAFWAFWSFLFFSAIWACATSLFFLCNKYLTLTFSNAFKIFLWFVNIFASSCSFLVLLSSCCFKYDSAFCFIRLSSSL